MRRLWIVLVCVWCGPASAQVPTFFVEHGGEQRLGPQLTQLVRAATSDVAPAATYRLRLVTAPSPCQDGILVSLILTRAGLFASHGFMLVPERDLPRVAKMIAADVARDIAALK